MDDKKVEKGTWAAGDAGLIPAVGVQAKGHSTLIDLQSLGNLSKCAHKPQAAGGCVC